MLVLLETCDLRLKEGQLPIASTNQFVVTEEMAAAMGIQLGDQIDSSVGKDISGESWYASIPVPLELVGILEGVGSGESVRLGIVSYEYVNNHELFGPPWVPGLILIPQPRYKSEVENFLENEIAPQNVTVSTYQKSLKRASGLSGFFYILFGIIDILGFDLERVGALGNIGVLLEGFIGPVAPVRVETNQAVFVGRSISVLIE